jgi:signal transduction histidine kinase
LQAIDRQFADAMSQALGLRQLRQALLNLLSNANKFTDHGTITIGARQREEDDRDWVTISVADTGTGMTAEQMGKLFQEFSQAAGASDRHAGSRSHRHNRPRPGWHSLPSVVRWS